ncbi:unnamed protein product, partial [Phaeothamnion confervicola]
MEELADHEGSTEGKLSGMAHRRLATTYMGLTIAGWTLIVVAIIVGLILFDRYLATARNVVVRIIDPAPPALPPAPAVQPEEPGWRREYDTAFEQDWHGTLSHFPSPRFMRDSLFRFSRLVVTLQPGNSTGRLLAVTISAHALEMTLLPLPGSSSLAIHLP